MEQIFLLEVLVDTIYFQNPNMMPQKKQIVIVATFGNFATLEIRTDTLGALEQGTESKRRDIDINFGKSYLFFCKPDDLLNALKKCPLEVVVSTKQSPLPLGKAIIHWDDEFTYMVNSANDNVGYITPTYQSDVFDLLDKDESIGTIDMLVRLSCFGRSITTNLQVVKPPKETKDGAPVQGNTKFLFKSANAATTFECQMYGMGTSQELIPISPLYQAADTHPDMRSMRTYNRGGRSEETITMESRTPSVFVMDMPVRDFNPIDLKNLADLLTGHRESIIVRPDVLEFINLEMLMELQHERIDADEYDPGRKERKARKEDPLNLMGSGSVLDSDDLTDLTVDKIEKMLCGHKDCPAAKMFKDFGIGPLATGKGLGTVYKPNEIQPHTTYGLSETSGNMARYGPFGVYSRPKRPAEPFIPKGDCSPAVSKSSSQCGSSQKSCKCHKSSRKLNGGNPDSFKLRGGEIIYKNDLVVYSPPLRLRGGGIINADELKGSKYRDQMKQLDRVVTDYKRSKEKQDVSPNSSKYSGRAYTNLCCNQDKKSKEQVTCDRLRGGGIIDAYQHDDTSPMSKCRDLMQEFDRVVGAYKNALGPCGKAICPFAQNILLDKCKQHCNIDSTSKSEQNGDSCSGPEDNMSACGNSTCEYRRRDEDPVADEFKKSQLKSACGEPTCAYVMQRLGINPDDDDGKVKYHELPRNCGIPACPYSAQEPLPPIHWDCPDPLPPNGVCRNRDCPITKRQHVVNCMYKAPASPCGAPICPYTPPPPCDFKGCPFAPIEPCPSYCPYKRDNKGTCPYAEPNPTNCCVDPNCPFNQDVSQGAGGECTAPPPHPPPKGDPDLCSNEECPYAVAARVAQPCDQGTCRATGGSLECDECQVEEEGGCKCMGSKGGGGEAKKQQKGQLELNSAIPGGSTGISRDIEPPIQKKEVVNHNERRRSKSSENEESIAHDNADIAGTSPLATTSEPSPATGTATALATAKPSHTSSSRRKRKHRRTPFVYDEGDNYPGMHVGHKLCNLPALNVPKNMGWLWNIKQHVGRLKPRRGWRPGAISKTIAARIEEHRRQLGILPPMSQKPSKRRLKKKKDGTYGMYESDEDEDVLPKPTLQIKKKDGCYWITMNPLKDPATLEENENPYIDCTPMQFKIAKGNDGEEVVKQCYCGGEEPIGSSDSELDIEFTPPAGIIHPERFRRKRNIVHIDTQYDTSDFMPPNIQLAKKASKDGKKGAKGDKKGGKGKGKGKGKKK